MVYLSNISITIVYGRLMKHFKLIAASIIAGLFLPMAANAGVATCVDTLDISSSPNKIKTASSSIIYTDPASVDVSQCGPYLGNTTNDLTADLGGYGYSDWVVLDKYDVDTASGNGSITGTGWGGTNGTFSFAALNNYSGDYLIALKFGSVYSTFLSDSVARDWGWNTDVDGDKKYALSNLTVLTRSIPEASAILLFGFGLLGLLVLKRRSV